LGQGWDRNDPAAESAPLRLTEEILVRGAFVGARGAFLESPVVVPLEHQDGGAPESISGITKQGYRR
jgi:hypothetical protein